MAKLFTGMVLLLLLSCMQDKKGTKGDLTTIDLTTFPEKNNVVNISEFVSTIRYLG